MKTIISSNDVANPTKTEHLTFLEFLNEVNDDPKYRSMKILDNGGNTIARVQIELESTLPLISTPIEAIETMKFFPVETVIGKYKDLTFEEDTLVEFNESECERINNSTSEIVYSEDLLRNVSLDAGGVAEYISGRNLPTGGRYVELLSTINPLTKTTYSVFLDRKFKDLFFFPSLHLLTSTDIKLNDQIILPIKCYSIGRISTKESIKERVYSLYHKLDFVPDKSIKFEEIELDKTQILDALEKSLQANETLSYGVSITKDTPTYIRDTMFPITYDKFQGINGEIQVARQDTVPIIFIQLGKIKTILSQTAKVKENFVPNSILFSNRANFFSLLDNGYNHHEDTVFSIAHQLY